MLQLLLNAFCFFTPVPVTWARKLLQQKIKLPAPRQVAIVHPTLPQREKANKLRPPRDSHTRAYKAHSPRSATLDRFIPSGEVGDMATILISIVFSLVLAVPPTGAVSQEQSNPRAPFGCAQPTKEQNEIIREAEKDHYTTRRVEFIGNTYTRDMVLRRRVTIGLQEGEIFTRRNLIRSLRNVSKLKTIHPVNVRDVELHLNRSEKTVDMIICFKEKERPGVGPKRPLKATAATKSTERLFLFDGNITFFSAGASWVDSP